MSGWVIFAVLLLLLKAYLKLTTGWCHSKARLDGKTAIVTGGNAGLGALTAKDLARRGARVILACRDIKKAERVRDEIIRETGNTDVEVRPLDLSSFASVRKFAASILATERALHVLVNNAGMTGNWGKRTKDGIEYAMQINHLGHFLLTILLLSLLKRTASARVVFVASIGHLFSLFNPDDLTNEKRVRLLDITTYMDTKLCNIVTAAQLAKLLAGSGVTVNSAHPGVVYTGIWYKLPASAQIIWKTLLLGFMKSAEEGVQSIIYTAVSEELENVSGKYIVDCKVSTMQLSPKARNEKFARRVWNSSCAVFGLPTLPEHNPSLSPYLDYSEKFCQQSSLGYRAQQAG